MNRRSPSRSLILALCVAGALLAPSAPAFADSSRQPAITEAHADGGVLRILGLNLDGGRPKVTLGTLQLSVVAVTATQLDALIPATVAPGSYLLTVTLGKGKSGGDDRNDDGKYDEFWVSIGGAGPQGPAGAAGPQGAMGPVGPQGIPGVAGAVGPQGLTGPSGPQGSTGVQGPQGVAGKDGATGPSGIDGATGPPGPQGSPGSGGSPFAIESLGGVPCTVAMCPGSTAATFDRISSLLVLSCVTIPANNTLRIQGALAVSLTITNSTELLSFTSDVQDFASENLHRPQGLPVAFDVAANNLCSGREVVVTVTRSRTQIPISTPPSLKLHGGSCAGASLDFAPSGKGLLIASVTCTFTMNGDKTLSIQ